MAKQKQTRPMHQFQAQEESYNAMVKSQRKACRTAHQLARAFEHSLDSFELVGVYEFQLEKAGCQTKH